MTRDRYVRPTKALIDLQALRSNWEVLSGLLSKGTGILAIVKANGYGHGSVTMAKACQSMGAVGVGVADVAEAVVLREGGYGGEILCLGALSQEVLPAVAQRNLIVTLHSPDMVAMASDFAKDLRTSLRVHVKVDTGMNRLGVDPLDWNLTAQMLAENPHLKVEGIFTHLSEPENPDRAFTDGQLLRYREATKVYEEILQKRLIRHAAKSGAIPTFPEAHFDWVRPGITLYGYPSVESGKERGKFNSVLEWRAPILQVKKIQRGASVGYNREFRAPRDMTIATVAAGYGDGYRRNYAGVGVGFRGTRCPIVGHICMDLFMIDVSAFSKVIAGEEVILLGQAKDGAPHAQELAKQENTISYEVLIGISNRVNREVIPESKP